MSRPRLLTKSRFKLGCECPTKLFFTGKPEYGNTNVDNAFLAALAEGGFQVGELAKLYHRGGIEIRELDAEKAATETADLLNRDNVILYEAALHHESLLVRVDILIKKGSSVQLIEVKAKSFDPSEEDPFYNKRELKKGLKQISSTWEPYLLDIAFQTHVAKKAFPKWKVTSALMLADKTSQATVDGLNQRFFLETQDGRTRAKVKADTKPSDLGDPILIQIPVDDEIKVIFENGVEEIPFLKKVEQLASAYTRDSMITPVLGSQCKSCEFRIPDKMKDSGLKSGFEKCWTAAALLGKSDFNRPFVFDIWNFRKAQKLIADNVYFMDQLSEDDISPTEKEDEVGLSSSQRQWIQVQKVVTKDQAPYIDHGGLASELNSWTFPLNMIDFETTMVAIPFNKGRRPYEQIAFQFSHHTVSEAGTIIHQTEYINRDQGLFPNFQFIRALKAALETNEGTVFRYAAHENTVLCQIRDQLKTSKEKDRTDLIAFIESITKSTGDSVDSWQGKRNMIDMCELVKKYFYHPLTGGSNSIKKVLPAILASSDFLQGRYSKPIYGADGGIQSKNFKNWQWIQKDKSGQIKDPYKLLPPVFNDLDLETMDSLITDGSITDGGAAMTAYTRMQFTQMSDEECDRVSAALLKYCELDTFAMVLVYQYWLNEIQNHSGKRAA